MLFNQTDPPAKRKKTQEINFRVHTNRKALARSAEIVTNKYLHWLIKNENSTFYQEN